MTELRLAAGLGLHLANGDGEGVGPEVERPAQPLEEGEGRRRVVAQTVEAIGEREVRGRAPPPVPAQTSRLERGAQGARREVEEVLAGLVVVPEAAEKTRLQPTHIRRDQVNDAARNEQPPNRGKRGNWIGEVLDAVVERDDVKAGHRKIQVLETTRAHAQSARAGLLRRERGDLHALDVPARSLRLEQEVTECAANVEETAAAPVPPLDRADAIAEGAAGHIGGEEVDRVPALRGV